MKEANTLEVIDSKLNQIPVGATLTVTRDHTNQFTNRRVLTVETEAETSHLGGFQIFQMTDGSETKDVWTEICVGRDSDTIAVNVN